MDLHFIQILVCLAAYLNMPMLEAGVVTNYKLDENCPQELIVHEFRMTDCTSMPCKIRREKQYVIEADFSVLRNISNPVLKCSSVYLGRHVDLPGHGGCDNLTKGQCPLIAGETYTTTTDFKVHYYVPPTTYTVYCNMIDDDDGNIICGWGSGKVV